MRGVECGGRTAVRPYDGAVPDGEVRFHFLPRCSRGKYGDRRWREREAGEAVEDVHFRFLPHVQADVVGELAGETPTPR
jgi:hypothetical protein